MSGVADAEEKESGTFFDEITSIEREHFPRRASSAEVSHAREKTLVRGIRSDRWHGPTWCRL